jgi:hypothetical protein
MPEIQIYKAKDGHIELNVNLRRNRMADTEATI